MTYAARPMLKRSLLTLCVLSFAGCGPMMTADGGVEDAGVLRDAGTVSDAGTLNDAGTDAGLINDAGTPTDAGTFVDAGIDAGTLDAGVDAGTPDAGAIICTANVDTMPCYTGAAGTLGVGPCVGGTKTCAADGRSYGACVGQHVPSTEDCATRVDEDCDGTVNQASAGCVCTPGATMPCYSGTAGTANVGVCHGGTALCAATGTSYEACQNEVVPSSDLCGDSLDQDCDGRADEFCTALYSTDVQPIFSVKCAPCHTGFGSGGHNMGTTYADTQLSSYYCPGKTKGQCSIVRIHDGTMPAGAGCDTNPTGAGCLTPTQQETVEGWVNSGTRP